MSAKIRFLKGLYLAGAFVDGLALLPMLFPSIRATLFGTTSAGFGPEYRYAISLAAALMAGWTVLLVWAFFKPVERRALLIFTVFPTLAGLIGATIYGITVEIGAVNKMIPLLVMQLILAVLYLTGYKMAKSLSTSHRE